ncbi:deoxyribonuclease IV [bacterium]|nr:deoxyribonuclease IV [bacterium]
MSKKKSILLLGGHISIAGGFDLAVERGASINCSAIQIFTRSNRQWGVKELTEQQVIDFKTALQKSCIRSVVVHLPYLINICSPLPKTRHASINSVKQELKRCNALGIKYIVLHPGSHVGQGAEVCLSGIAKGLNEALAADEGNTMILLENMAGQGTNVGHKFENLGFIIKKIEKKNRVGICFDTCHAFAAGYDFRTKDGYEAMWQEFDKHIGLEKLKVMHINDSKKELATYVDRHENIGEGKLGLDPFRFLFNDKRFFDIPKILETPNATLELYAKNMEIIKTLLTKETKEVLDIL